MKKHKRAKAIRAALARPPLTFDVLTVCFATRTIEYKGRTITTESDCLSIPLTNDVAAVARNGWYP